MRDSEETAAELRARLGALTEAGHPMASRAHMKFAVALVNAWPAIDGMLARLAAAEADADQAIGALKYIARLNYSDLTVDLPKVGRLAIKAHDDALALRTQQS